MPRRSVAFRLVPRLALHWSVCMLGLSGCRSRPPSGLSPELPRFRAVADAYARAPAARDANAIVQFFAPEVVVMSPQGRGPVRGIDGNRAAWERFFRGGNPVHTMTTDSVFVSEDGSMGYALGHWTVGVDTPTGRAEAAGEYLAVWRRRNDEWKIVAVSAYPFR